MANKITKPFGCWNSPISAEIVAGKNPKISEPSIQRGPTGEYHYFWLQSCPEEKGRTTIMMMQGDSPINLLPRPLSAASKVHEYGGGSYCVAGNTVYFVLADDQRIYCIDWTQPSSEPHALTEATDANKRYADLTYCEHSQLLFAVCEEHTPTSPHAEPHNYLLAINPATKTTRILHRGEDFYSNPRPSPCGTKLCWISWNHSAMPWNNTQLWLADIEDNGTLANAHIIKGANKDQSLFQPMWHPTGELFCVSDKSNWWNIYRCPSSALGQNTSDDDWLAVTNLEAEFATPQWVFGMKTYGLLDDNTLFSCYSANGKWYTATVENCLSSSPSVQPVDPINEQLSECEGVVCAANQAVFIGANAASLPSIYRWDNTQTTFTTIHANALPVHSENISHPQPFSFAVSSEMQTSQIGHGFYYAPTNQTYCGPTDATSDERPPVIVLCHGGPTGATSTSFNPKIQYWTSRGFAVMDINYRGSTGYGREYRESLHKNWGVYDVDDMCAATQYAIDKGWAAPSKAIIKGSSAGGYTVLAALTFKNIFNAGVSLYGIGDLETLACDTHKFEARYLDTLIGPYPEQKQLYIDRSPIHYAEKITCPVLVFQGMQDKVVPPNQAQNMVEKVRANGVKVTYKTFENEGHGFRDGNNIRTMLETELAFYQTTFNLNGN
ncbi:alpha/beta hydrolase family protein [Saccharophagus degradans]|uniref:Peptidase S9, prolyl oligopeptidase active site region n=1 Tax=Saccharophagus degradans (strain 2-40 / ATCC 43961 / DSM 17024) TaxID=203122 RepID=Q21LD1_SACD2|nr:prolyl oligopeptidase family serine peptidase [Saccharophagus degradans]ABD80498.1 peptidase S9, prolyl oligopeptidase active site region [Saccharophagus degradans 2-40]